MFLASNCTCAVYFTYTAHVQLLAKNMAATHVHVTCTRICIRNQTNILRFCREDNPLYVFTLRSGWLLKCQNILYKYRMASDKVLNVFHVDRRRPNAKAGESRGRDPGQASDYALRAPTLLTVAQ